MCNSYVKTFIFLYQCKLNKMYINILFVAIISIRNANIKYKINIYYNLNLKNVAIKAYIIYFACSVY